MAVTTGASAVRIVEVIGYARERGASDVHVPPREAPAVRIDGELVRLTDRAFAADEIAAYVQATFDDVARERFAAEGTADMTIADERFGALRVHAFRERRGLRLAIRLLATDVPSLEALGLPNAVDGLAERRTGLILVTGPTGCGKSTAVAALVDRINRTAARHIVTIEDPIEYYHQPIRSLIAHREVGRDVASFADALRGFMRADPDVIVIGELRDRETMSAALSAAETGHLVIATLHTAETVQAVDRLVDAFPGPEQTQIRTQLALTLAAVVGLRLVKVKSGVGRRAACEVLIATDAVRALVRENKAHQLRNAIATGRAFGMQTLESHLDELVALGTIDADDASRATDRPSELRGYRR
jgi:twitching motility protein PilT